MERGTIKIGAPENRIVNAVYMRFVLTPRDDDLLYPALGPVLTAPIDYADKTQQKCQMIFWKKSVFPAENNRTKAPLEVCIGSWVLLLMGKAEQEELEFDGEQKKNLQKLTKIFRIL